MRFPRFGKFAFELLAVLALSRIFGLNDHLAHVGKTLEIPVGGRNPSIDVCNSVKPHLKHALAFPNLQGFACNPAVFVAVQLNGDTGFPVTYHASLVVHTSPNCDNVVQHFLQSANDIAWCFSCLLVNLACSTSK